MLIKVDKIIHCFISDGCELWLKLWLMYLYQQKSFHATCIRFDSRRYYTDVTFLCETSISCSNNVNVSTSCTNNLQFLSFSAVTLVFNLTAFSTNLETRNC